MENFIKNTDWQVLTPSGWSDFDGIKKTTKVGGVHLKIKDILTDTSLELICSKRHKIKLLTDEFVYACEIEPGCILKGDCEVVDVIPLSESEHVFYDLIGVEKNNEYFTNDIVSHNCAHIQESIVTELWLSVAPALSTGGSAILISTPNGTENLFYRLWSQALEGGNEFKTTELPWTVHPERDQAWYNKESAIVRASKGEIGVQQEFHCVFVGSGDTFVRQELLLELEKICKDYISERHEKFLDLNVWEKPLSGESYLITADVASGIGDDYSTICILKTSTGDVVADYKAKIVPQEFGPLLVEVGKEYNTAVLCPEQNTYGLIVCEHLRKEKYPKLYYQKMNTITEIDTYQAEQFEIPGWRTDEGSRPGMLAKLDYMLSTGKLKPKSKLFIDELKNFVMKNNKPQAKKGKNDDLVIAYAIAAKLLSTADEEVIAESDGKPLINFSELREMVAGIKSQTTVLDLEQRRVVNNNIDNDEVEKNKKDPTKIWNWIF